MMGIPERLLYQNTVHAVLDPAVTDILINPCSIEWLIQILIQMLKESIAESFLDTILGYLRKDCAKHF